MKWNKLLKAIGLTIACSLAGVILRYGAEFLLTNMATPYIMIPAGTIFFCLLVYFFYSTLPNR